MLTLMQNPNLSPKRDVNQEFQTRDIPRQLSQKLVSGVRTLNPHTQNPVEASEFAAIEGLI